MSEAPTYKIKSITDLLAVPEDRLAECLRELPAWLAALRAFHALHQQLGRQAFKLPDTYEWIDDGKGELTIRGTAGGKEYVREVHPIADFLG